MEESNTNDFGLEPENPENKMTTEEFREYIKGSSFLMAKKDFDFDKIFKFSQEHRVEILLQEDSMYHCFIDWHLPEGKGSWAIEFDAFTSMILGINEYIRHDGKPSTGN